MTDEKPTYWWQGADGAKVIRAAWKAVEDVARLGADAKIIYRKDGEPTLTIAFDHDLTEEDEAELEAELPSVEEPTVGEPDEDGF